MPDDPRTTGQPKGLVRALRRDEGVVLEVNGKRIGEVICVEPRSSRAYVLFSFPQAVRIRTRERSA